MLSETQSPPDDPAELRDTRAAAGLSRQVAGMRIAKLEHQLAGMRRHQARQPIGELGPARADARGRGDRSGQGHAARPLPSDTDETVKKEKPKRKPLPADLPRNEEVMSPGAACGRRGGKLKTLGEDVTEELDYLPGRFVVNRIVAAAHGLQVLRDHLPGAFSPSRPIERGRPGPGLLAHVLISNMLITFPLYRQWSQIFEREGIDLDRSTLCDWVGMSTASSEPLADAIGRHVLSGTAIFADDTPPKMQAPEKDRHKDRSHLDLPLATSGLGSALIRRLAWYRFTVDRKGNTPPSISPTTRAGVHADGYSGFNELYRSGGIREVACVAQIRRKFVDVFQAESLGHRRGSDQADRRALCRREGCGRGRPPTVDEPLRGGGRRSRRRGDPARDIRKSEREGHPQPRAQEAALPTTRARTSPTPSAQVAPRSRWRQTEQPGIRKSELARPSASPERFKKLRPYLDHGCRARNNPAKEP